MTSRAVRSTPNASDIIEALTKEMGIEPAVVHLMPWPAYEVDFAALEFESEEALSPVDRAMLSLIAARGLASGVDAARYLGLGIEVSRLTLEKLIQEGWVGRTEPDLTRFVRSQAKVIDGAPPQGARNVQLLAPGQEVLTAGKKTVRTRRHARLVFWAAPLRYLWTARESGARYAVGSRREAPIEVEAVPPSLRAIDDVLALAPQDRATAIGIEERVPALPGRLVGVAPGAGWEVRGAESQAVLAAFPHSGEAPLTWHVFAIFNDRLIPCAELAGASVDAVGLSRPGRLNELVREHGAGVLDERGSYTGAYRLLCEDAAVFDRASGSEPAEQWLSVAAASVGTTMMRVRAVPASRAAADRALVSMVRRNREEYRANPARAVLAVWESLQAFWEVPPSPPPDQQWVAGELWRSHDMRRVMCEVRFTADLILPYEPSEATA